jgi:hypothetical protein
MRRLPTLLVAAAVLAFVGCGESEPSANPAAGEAAADTSGWVGLALTPEAGFDPEDPALQTIPDGEAHAKAVVRKAGRRKDFKVPMGAVAGLRPGPLVLGVVLRPFYELDPEDADRLNAAQRAVYSIYYADFEILNGGFAQFYSNASGALANELLPAAHRVGSAELIGIFRDAAALWPGGEAPADRDMRAALLERIDAGALAALDERYAGLQYRRATSLANLLAPYIGAHMDAFVAG